MANFRRTAFDPSRSPRPTAGRGYSTLHGPRTHGGSGSSALQKRGGKNESDFEARSALGAGEAGGADHQGRVVYQRAGRQASEGPTVSATSSASPQFVGSRPTRSLDVMRTLGPPCKNEIIAGCRSSLDQKSYSPAADLVGAASALSASLRRSTTGSSTRQTASPRVATRRSGRFSDRSTAFDPTSRKT